MMRVLIGAGAVDPAGLLDRRVFWVGEVDWPSVPPVGATWVHCGGWDGETIWRVYFCGPGDDGPDSGVQVEVRSTSDVLDHLIERHGFAEQ